ncbi:hypothetical protein COT94_00170 [Candidatus Falkowbacteria bacterium CG10_big_fil_rev_8_21_14_0_10_37_14]|uniref:HTH cro/C1-type domain-containing protein n=1 Tax=Candidatus Falkowbacteria bacterium CG10_big_fil_rev_8_21_14_0_10_37_14 TaxID=1974561 RepID=A0A2M6WUQ0_9BACT|nr:hypothetical protein [Candidatus Falkowbacteria bacterium]PIT96481.1 MAG: hypothetical protein COT94_00170 [Candidatus Falkowbacteria bacterium CG10_big_fil_rev_8_21_14_0_10_37_14]
MPIFAAKPVGEKYSAVGERLRLARQREQKSIKDKADELNIQARYLTALENNTYDSLPAGVYALNYLREYSRSLGLPETALIEQFIKERHRRQTKSTGIFERQVVLQRYFIVVPRVVKGFLIAIVSLICVGYIGWLLANIYLPPKLNLFSPVDNLAVSEQRITVSGQTEPESEVAINGLPVIVSVDGKFEITLDLRQGINKITVIASRQNKRQHSITREILYRKP